MKKVYLIHCWDGTIKDGWYPWLRNTLEKSNIQVIMENMPNTSEPKINEWVSKLDSLVTSLDNDTYFIGHSIGCQTIMRYLETKDITKIGGILFIAPWFSLLPPALEDGADEIAAEWINTPINFEKIKQFTNNINCIFSDNDYFVSLDQEKEFSNKLNSKNIIVNNKGHISGDDDITELPTILNTTGEMMGIEFIDIVDLEGNFTGEVLNKDLAHDRNLLHNEIGIFIFNSKYELLIQKRATTKRYNPNMWGLCAGHVNYKEDLIDACIREAKEELGIDIKRNNLHLFDRIIKNRESNSHVTYEYYTYLDLDINDFTIQKEELSEIKWIPFNEYKKMVVDNNPTITLKNTSDNLEMLEKIEKILSVLKKYQ